LIRFGTGIVLAAILMYLLSKTKEWLSDLLEKSLQKLKDNGAYSLAQNLLDADAGSTVSGSVRGVKVLAVLYSVDKKKAEGELDQIQTSSGPTLTEGMKCDHRGGVELHPGSTEAWLFFPVEVPKDTTQQIRDDVIESLIRIRETQPPSPSQTASED
jgi:hypothetical protein